MLLPGTLNARTHALDVTLNSREVGTWEMLEFQGGYWVEAAVLREWRLLMPAAAKPTFHQGRLWWPLFAVPGYRASFDHTRQTLSVNVDASAFEQHQLKGPSPRSIEVAPAISAFLLNYDISWTESRNANSAQSDRGLLTEAGWTSPWGVLLSSQVSRWQHLGESPPQYKQARLETSWTRDWPDRSLRLRIGDSWTPPSSWGRQAAFGGVQLGSSRWFGLPGSAMATPVLTGSTLTPSTVELYVNDVLRQSIQVPAGPFALNQVPSLNGAGDARLIVRDVLGRETVINKPFLVTPQLFSAGHQDWSVEAGRLRQGFGIDASQQGYGNPVAQLWLRRGVSDQVTAEGRMQGGSGLANIGAAATMAAWNRALLETAWAGSSFEGRKGASALLGLQHLGRTHTWSIRALSSSRDYTEAGRAALERPAKLEASASWRAALDGGTAWGMTLATLHRHDDAVVRSGSFSFTQRLAHRASLVWMASRITSTGSSSFIPVGTSSRQITALQMLLVMPLGSGSEGTRPVVTAQWLKPSDSQGARQGDALLNAYASPVSEASWGWRLQAGQRAGQSIAEGSLYRQTAPAFIGLDAWSQEGGVSALRGTVQGAWVWAEGRLHTANRVKDSFALVEVPGLEGVGVSTDGAALARTDSSGWALIPRLAAYQSNRVRLDPNDIRPEAEVDTLEAITAAPWRSGVKVRFPVRSGYGALLSFTVAEDESAPVGATLILESDDRVFTVGTGGRAYVTGLNAEQTRRATLNWRGKACDIELRWSASDMHDALSKGLPRLGPWRCPEIIP